MRNSEIVRVGKKKQREGIVREIEIEEETAMRLMKDVRVATLRSH